MSLEQEQQVQEEQQQQQQQQQEQKQDDAENMYPKIGDVVTVDKDMPTEMESLCMECHKKGTTRLLFTDIPFFREIILMSFRCPHCGWSNNEIQSGSRVQDRGTKYRLRLESEEDFQRQLVKSDHATLTVEELEFEIPKGKGCFSTIEGILRTALDELKDSQEQRRLVAPEVAAQVDEFIGRFALLLSGLSFPVHLVLDDPTGNSFLENPNAPKADPKLHVNRYVRTKEQNEALGLQLESYENEEEMLAGELDKTQTELEAEATLEQRRQELAASFHAPEGSTIARDKADDALARIMEKEVFQIPTNCPNCGTEGTSKTCITDIPFFKEVIIMAFDCPSDACGYRTSEVKGGGAIPDKGKEIRLFVPAQEELGRVAWQEDMSRDVVKSNSSGVFIPELEIEVTQGSLGGMYTTVEGLLTLVKETLFEGQAADFSTGDSAQDSVRGKFQELETRFEGMIAGEEAFTLVIRDPLANSYIYSPTAPEPEERLTEILYDRSFDDNEELGLNDMRTEDYEDSAETEPAMSPGAVTATPAPVPVVPAIDYAKSSFDGPFTSFQGARAGMVFRLGDRGLGYYSDASQQNLVRSEAAHEAQSKFRNLQKDGKEAHPQASILTPPDAVDRQ
ncbi:Zinc finger protein ZPR1-like [Hondaea fermentalgiana]|uniref:Zinc finger protein ZPR1-like n=1 Tax=Hondaea fermentalgiana TaxID=2315210 RepID=A0A2R5GHH9_9STRA|nr:Zinc finger protein ZPR1-like [Hondaea fermentalgiana]|eukprot:GBG27334.1 Zinc finger protein ZPR1-like [Hondaea fermentalgiana]